MPENGTDRKTGRPRYWTIAGEDSATGVVSIDGGEALAVFGFREEAELFLRFEEAAAGWRVREATAGELISVLYGPCVGVERVLIDPLPQRIAVGAGIAHLSMNKEAFTRLLSETVGAVGGSIPALASLRP